MVVNHRCAVLGKPIAHSLSPVLHNAAYRAMGLDDWTYDKREVGEEDLHGFLTSLDSSWAGLSLTMPLKRTIQTYGSPRDYWVPKLKVANTVVFDWLDEEGNAKTSGPTDAVIGDTQPAPILTCANGERARLRLYNTDVIGIQIAFDRARQAQGLEQPPTGSYTERALVLGNGNTATSAVAALTAMSGVGNITVAARHPCKNPALKTMATQSLSPLSPSKDDQPFEEISLADEAAVIDAASQASLIVSTIPGLGADMVADTLCKAAPAVHGTLLDVVYDPRPTKLMQAWRSLDGLAIGGEEMLLYQAFFQVLLMTGTWNDIDTPDDDRIEQAMRQALEEAL